MYKHESINRVYKLVWSHLRRMWVPVPEHKSACAGKQAKRKQHALLSSVSLVMAAGLSPGMSNAEPTGGVVKSGSASIKSDGNTGAIVTTIKQNNPGVLGLEWSSFNIGRNETVNFIQPTVNSVAFNRILDSQGSQILGKINANGSVWLVNPNGLFFGRDAQVNVGGLVASTLNTMNPQGFGSYSQNLAGNSTATIENQGLINAGYSTPPGTPKVGGFVALVGHSVKNTGDIKTAEGGKIALAAGSDVDLQFSANSLIGVSINQNQLNTMAVNGGLMQADGGQVILTAGAANSALASVVNNTGVMQAKSSAMFRGRIVLSSAAKDGQLNLSGRLDASGTNGADGGEISTQASVIRVSDGTEVDTCSTNGSWGKWSLVQKNTNQSTADAKLSSMISGTALGKALNHSNVSLYTDKDLQIDTPVSWNEPSKLSLVAQRNIAIDAPINSAHASGSISLAYGQASTNGTVNGVKSSYAVKAPVSLMEGNNFTTQLGNAGAVKNFYVITRLGLAGSNTGKDLQGNLVNNILVVVTTPITPDDPEDNTVAQNLTPDNGSNKTPSDTSNTPVPPRVDNKNNNGNQEGKTDRPVVIPTIKDLQANPLAKINSLPSADAQAVNAATRLSSLEDDYWFLDCFFNSSQELKKIKCEPISQKKSPSLEIKKYPNKKLSALNSPLLP